MKTIIFDFDGTIADSFDVFVTTFQDITGRKQVFSEAEIAVLRKSTIREIMRQTGVKKWQIPRLLTRGRREAQGRMRSVQPFGGIVEAIKQFKADGYELYIVSTNSETIIREFLDRADLSDCFYGITADIGLLGKVKALKKLLKRTGRPASECVYIGDETRDIEAARKVGLDCVAVAWGYNHPDILQTHSPTALAATPKDLPSIINSL